MRSIGSTIDSLQQLEIHFAINTLKSQECSGMRKMNSDQSKLAVAYLKPDVLYTRAKIPKHRTGMDPSYQKMTSKLPEKLVAVT